MIPPSYWKVRHAFVDLKDCFNDIDKIYKLLNLNICATNWDQNGVPVNPLSTINLITCAAGRLNIKKAFPADVGIPIMKIRRSYLYNENPYICKD